MSTSLHIQVFDKQQLIFADELDGPIELGRQRQKEQSSYRPVRESEHWRLFIALASRVQGATKYMKVRTLITGTTHQALDKTFHTHSLGRVRVVNIAEPVALHELALPGQANWEHLQQAYQQALADFERKEFRKVIRTLGNLLVDYPDDGPALVLLSRAVNFLVVEPDKVDTGWELPGK